jgi:hypothetical protein
MINIKSDSIDIKKFSDLASLGNTGLGILLVILASMISGISTALTQKTLLQLKQEFQRHYNQEML